MSTRNSSNVRGYQIGGGVTVTDTATTIGRDKRSEVGGGRGAGAGINTNIQVVTRFVPSLDVETNIVTEVLASCKALASV
jgi:hypothetical protein